MSIAPTHDLAVNQQGHYAGAVTRLVAFIIDQSVATALFSFATAALSFVIALISGDRLTFEYPPLVLGAGYLMWLFLYYAYPWATSGKTLGMSLLGLRVVRRDGADAGVGHAVTRTLALPLSFLTLGLGFVGIVTNREHRALHDRIANTVVVYDWDARAARLRFLARRRERSATVTAATAATDAQVADPGRTDPRT